MAFGSDTNIGWEERVFDVALFATNTTISTISLLSALRAPRSYSCETVELKPSSGITIV
jgi:hypothetical protein